MRRNWEEKVFKIFNQDLGSKEVSEKLGMPCNKIRYLRQIWLAEQKRFESYTAYLD